MQTVVDAPQQLNNSSLGSIAESSSHAKDNTKNATIRKRFKLLDTAARLLPNERIAKCQRHAAPLAAEIVGSYQPETKTAHLHNLQRCESYSCPVCANQRSEHDRLELSIAISTAAKHNLFPVLITCTLRHHQTDQLHDLQNVLAEAFDKTFSGRWYQDLKDEYGIATKVKSWDITYGANGWHPHLHVLMFMEMELAGKWVTDFGDKIKARWQQQLTKLGRDASWEHGIDVRTADSDIAQYIAKWGREPIDKNWGVEHELAKVPVKKSVKDGVTPFELLAAAAGYGDVLEKLAILFEVDFDDEQQRLLLRRRAGALYKEYFYVFKGVARIYWGKLKKLIDFDQAYEEFQQNNPPEPVESVEIVKIPAGETWKYVYINGLIIGLMEAIGTGDLKTVKDFMKKNKIYGHVGGEVVIPDQESEPPPAAAGRMFEDEPPAAARPRILWANPKTGLMEFVEEIPNE